MRTNDELLMEGIFDRMRAKSAGRKAERDAGVTLGTKALGAGSKFLNKATGGNIAGSSKLQKTLDKGSVAKSSAQVANISTAYMQKLKAIADKFAVDIKRLNVDPSMIEDDAVRQILQSLLKYTP